MYEKTLESLGKLGENEEIRRKMIKLCVEAEPTLAELNFDVREEITGPIVDALHSKIEKTKKRLKSGIEFRFLYRSKIARDFVMSDEEEPDHVWEPQTTKLLVHLAKNCEHVVIGGAYSGDQAILVASSSANYGTRLHCFEPNREQIEMLRLNASFNGIDNIVANQLCLWEDETNQLVLVGYDSFAHPKLSMKGGNHEAFSTITLNTYGEERNIKNFGLIMLDIEGAELPALRGSDNYLKQPADKAPKLVFEVHSDYVNWSNGLENTDIYQYLEEFGYHLYAVRDYQSNVKMTGMPIELVSCDAVYLEGPSHGFNMLGVKDNSIVTCDLFRIRSGVSPKLLPHREPMLHQPLD